MTIDAGKSEADQAAVLLLFLEAAVPMWISTVSAWSPERRIREGYEAGELLACGADVLFRPDDTYPGSVAKRLAKPNVLTITREQADAGVKAIGFRPAEIFNAIAKGLALGALLPGGVTWLGRHWCTAPHGKCPGEASAPALFDLADEAPADLEAM